MACLRLALTEGIGPRGFQLLIGADEVGVIGSGRPRGVVKSASALLNREDALEFAPSDWLDRYERALSRASRVSLDGLADRDFVCWSDQDYPAQLRILVDPPIVLWYKGRRPVPQERFVAMVGTRQATAYGRRMAAELAKSFSTAGLTVVSGLALGIDGASHRGALEGAAGTVAVLGTGIDRVFPALHRDLATQIIQNGTLLTEFPPGTRATKFNFPRRNRIIAGMSQAVLVVEARDRGGALLTAHIARDNQVPVMAVPGDIGRPSSTGTNRLIVEGAIAVTDAAQVIGDLMEASPTGTRTSDHEASVPIFSPATREVAGRRSEYGPSGALLAFINKEPQSVDTICADAGLHVSDTLVLLLDLELRGAVRQYPGKRYGLS
ncbi:MAG: DNA processing protein [Rhodothermales bacterium]|jgi:DNA processing protein